ncbi:MAG: inositol phosphate phosphatase SopB, partial [Verrucomicrobiota bacterium]
MNEFNTYENLAKTYDTSWSGFFGLSGSSKNIQSNKLKDAPQSIFFGNFSVTYLSRSRSSPSCSTASTTSTPSTSSSEGASLPTHIGSAFRAAIVSKYGDSVAAAMDTQFSLSTATQLSEKQISKIIKAVSSPTLPARLNQGTWSIINKTISSADSGLQGDYHSAMVATTEILSSSYEADGVKGVCSRDYKNEKHSINAWSDTLKSADGRTLFACARSGVMAVLDPIKQESTFDARLNENILTALYARGKLPTEGNNENNPIQLSLVDIGLVSNYEWSLGEGKIQTAQFDLVSKANGKMRSISYTPPGATESITIHVMPQIRAVNIGTQVGDSLYNPNQAQSDAAIKLIFKEVETKLPHMEKAAAQLWTWSDKPDQSMLDSDNPSNLIDQGIGDSKESNALLLAYLSELKTAPPANSESLKQAFQRKSLELRVTKELHAQCEEMQRQRIYDTENEGGYCAFHARFNLLC